MNPVRASNPVGEQLAEAILAAALALPLAFAMAGVKHSRLIRDLDSLPKINWSSASSLPSVSAKADVSLAPALGQAAGRVTKTKSQLSTSHLVTQPNRDFADAAGSISSVKHKPSPGARSRLILLQKPEQATQAKQ